MLLVLLLKSTSPGSLLKTESFMLVDRHPVLMSPTLLRVHETHVFTGRTDGQAF